MATKSSEPSPGTVKAPFTTETLPARVELLDHPHPYVFGVDMADASVVLVDDAQHVVTGEGHVARTEQKRQPLARMLHEQVELRLSLDRGGHVVVVGYGHSLPRAPLPEGSHVAAIDPDLLLGKVRLGGRGR